MCKRAKSYLVEHVGFADGPDTVGDGDVRSCEGVLRVLLEECHERCLPQEMTDFRWDVVVGDGLEDVGYRM